MSDRDGLMAAILDRPTDETPRLVFADWCDDHGDEGWAYLIRSGGDHPTVCPPGSPADVYFYPGPAAGTTYTVKLAEGIRDVSFVVTRGFVDEVRLPLAAFLEHAPALFAAHPLTRVVLTDREPNDYGPPADDCRFGWLPEDHRIDPGPAVLPRAIHQALADNDKGDGILRWATRDAALAALSAAAVAYGRDSARAPA
jgi:uncharacterized protein (TIGR02996 family)